jgi:hypothetical protein
MGWGYDGEFKKVIGSVLPLFFFFLIHCQGKQRYKKQQKTKQLKA